MFTDILWRFLILDTFVLGGVWYVCFDEHPQKQFCDSEFVVMVKFYDAKKLPGLKMKIIKVFKGNMDELSFRDNRYLNSNVVKPFNFKVGKKYYLFGRNVLGIIYFTMCNGVLPWEYTTQIQRRAMVAAYAAGCECVDEIGNYSSFSRCQWFFSFVFKFGTVCEWVKYVNSTSCQEKINRYLN